MKLSSLTKKQRQDLITSPFFEQWSEQVETGQMMNINGKETPAAIWNLICSKRDLTLWCNIGMKPHRHWKVSDVKRYFGITGGRTTLLKKFMVIYDAIMGEDVE